VCACVRACERKRERERESRMIETEKERERGRGEKKRAEEEGELDRRELVDRKWGNGTSQVIKVQKKGAVRVRERERVRACVRA
jgi:hypothetical protein